MSNEKQLSLFGFPQQPDDGYYIFTMTIRLKNGRIIRRANGRPFRIRVKNPAH